MESSVFAIIVQHAVNVIREVVGKGIAETEKAERFSIVGFSGLPPWMKNMRG